MAIFTNAKIYTESGIKSWMEVHDGVIQKIGTGEREGRDMNGKIILPGLIDAHLHVFGIGRMTDDLLLRGTGSIIELQAKLEEYAKGREGWIVGRGWDQDRFEDKRFPSRKDLDAIIKDQPVILYRACHHIAVVNSKALEIAQITEETPNPDGGEIEQLNGQLTGILKENAMELVSTLIQVDRNKRKALIQLGLEECLRLGLTMVQTNDAKAWDIYKEIQEENNLPIRVSLTPYHKEMDLAPPAGTSIGLLYCDRVKLFADGSLGARTAAMREEYADEPIKGIPIYTQEELNNLVREATERGYRVEIHAIGDKAAEITINAIEHGGATDRPILTHAQILGKDLIDRMQALGIIANIQPPFIITDGNWVDKRVGDTERRKYSYAWKTLIDRGIQVSGGSDAPIESPNPLLGMYSAMYREVNNGKVWREEECISFDQALRLYTSAAAYTSKMEDRIGKLHPGYKADFVVVSEDVIDNPRLLKTALIEEVYIEGQKKL
ncbi:MAG: amidohydrolase [Candidatus Heimdallarchaeota archaeon]|nr:amidohydrolase [Candidatus Heimdallarchaeota archaeon]